jgi:RNA polymerase sigma-70 factor (ECF subfamily)
MEYERFASLVGPHTDAMARVAGALVGVADAEDAAQEALMRAWRAWPSLREPGAVRTWLLRITTNVCRNWQAGHFGTHRRATQSLDDATSQELLYRVGVSGPGNSDHAAALDLQGAVASLGEELRHVVALRFYAGMDATEIGELLDTPPATIRTRLRRALMLLRDALGPAPGQASGQAHSPAPDASPIGDRVIRAEPLQARRTAPSIQSPLPGIERGM